MRGESEMKAIALQGVASSGKTTVLKILIDMLRGDGRIIACGKRKKVDPSTDRLQKRLLEEGDLWVLICYHGKLVGIATEGDYFSDIEETLKTICDYADAKKQKPDIFICAIHTGDGMLNKLKSIIPDLHIVPQYKANMEEYIEKACQISNLAQAILLKNLLCTYAP